MVAGFDHQGQGHGLAQHHRGAAGVRAVSQHAGHIDDGCGLITSDCHLWQPLDPAQYYQSACQLLEYTRRYLTTKAMASYVLQTMGWDVTAQGESLILV